MNGRTKTTLAALVATALLGYLFGWSSVLEIRTIEVVGIKNSQTLTSKEIIRKSGIRKGDKLARINARSIARALDSFSEISHVEINRKPLHRLEIALTLRRVELAIATQQGKYLLGDGNGITFTEVSRPPRGVPIISGDRQFIVDAMEIYRALPESLRKKVESVELPSKASITFILRGGLRILWGAVENQEAKLTVLTALLAEPENKKARFIDISTPLTPTVR